MNIAILYGSSLGNTQFVAQKIHRFFPDALLSSVNDVDLEALALCDLVILGTSTWGVGDMQDDFEMFVNGLLKSNLEGKRYALFGLGDQNNYPDSFCNGMGKLYRLLTTKKVQFLGGWPTVGYDFSESEAVVDDFFVGLAIDEENEPDLTEGRVAKWSQQLLRELREINS